VSEGKNRIQGCLRKKQKQILQGFVALFGTRGFKLHAKENHDGFQIGAGM
jgi:hypothetical protein